jgi:hypothetical protein
MVPPEKTEQVVEALTGRKRPPPYKGIGGHQDAKPITQLG